MKYKELISFEPITEVVKFDKTFNDDYQKNLIQTFVFSDTFKDILIPLIVKNLDFTKTGETFGLQIVGNYGTGKSHLMSLVSLIADNEALCELVKEEGPQKALATIAGKFKVLRFELGGTDSLWDFVTSKIEEYFASIGIDFSFDGHGIITYADKLKIMMAEFEEKFPDKGFMLVIDEMLAYLKGRGASDKLNQDLQVLQALGQACDSSKFKFMFGVQEMIYQSAEFQFAAEMLQKVNDRYKDIMITKADVAFIVKNRLLQKTEHQKQEIRNHLDQFLNLFTDMHGRTNEYVELFPVHPSYFDNFEKIRTGKSQREILKTLSNQFRNILDLDVPTDNPGLLTYDRYWEDIQKSQDLMADPDIRKVKEVTDTIADKIETFFTGARASKIPIAKRITNACAIKLLQDDLNKKNGTNSEHLVDDLCLTDKLASDRDFLVDIIETAAKSIVTATSGQYFDKNADNGEYYLRIEGGVNYDQKIKDYATTMADSQKDEYFFKFLEKNLPLEYNTYRTGFNIWQHTIDWKSHKTYREGYIFFGNPDQKSTTQPRQHFYMYFMPIFDEAKKRRNHEPDEVYFVFESLSKEFREAVTLYGAAMSLEVRADSSQKVHYRQKIDELNKKSRSFFEQEYMQVAQVDYMGKELPLNGYPVLGSGYTKEQIFSDVASQVFESWFSEEISHYPKFTQLNQSVSKDNFERHIKSALSKVAAPEQADRNGEGILAGLGLWQPGSLDIADSPYAKSVLKQLKAKGEGKVLNRDEIIEYVDKSDNLWLSKDFKIEAELEFIVLATLAALGEVEIKLSSGKAINSSNLPELKNIGKEDYYSFTHIKQPQGINEAALKALFMQLLGRDLSKQLKDPTTYVSLVAAAEAAAKKAVYTLSKIRNGLNFKGIELISDEEAAAYGRDFTAFSGFCDKVASYNSEAKLKNFPFSVDDINRIVAAKKDIDSIASLLGELQDFEKGISYLRQCQQYVSEESLRTEIAETIDELPKVLKASQAAKNAYKTKLDLLKNQYADDYLKQYIKHRISEADNTQKSALLDSNEKQICDILREVDFLSTGQYSQWLAKLDKLKPADPAVNKALILEAPYQDFNPADYTRASTLTVKQLRLELNELLSQWVQTLKDTLEDPMVKKNLGLLDKSLADLLRKFETDEVSLSKDNALPIRNAIMTLHEGLEKLEVSVASMKSHFSKPLTPDEAITAFKEYIDQLTKGKERDKIRIIVQ